MDYLALANDCAAQVHPVTMAALMQVESSQNPFAIGVVDGVLARPPRNKAEAIATARALERGGWNFSVGQAQVNRYNLAKYGLTYESAFEPCPNMRAGAAILKDCYDRALPQFRDPQQALQAALSCYYSGNFKRGFMPDVKGKPSYVAKVLTSAAAINAAPPTTGLAIPVIPKKARNAPDRTDAPASVPAPAVTGVVAAAAVQVIAPAPRKARPAGVPSKYDGYQADDNQDAAPSAAATASAPIQSPAAIRQTGDPSGAVVLRAVAQPRDKFKPAGVPMSYDGYGDEEGLVSSPREGYALSKAN